MDLGHAATNPDSPLDFPQAQSAAERSGVAGQHRWSIMLPHRYMNPSLVYSIQCCVAGCMIHGKLALPPFVQITVLLQASVLSTGATTLRVMKHYIACTHGGVLSNRQQRAGQRGWAGGGAMD